MPQASVPARPRLTFVLVALGALTYTLLQAMLVPALPILQRELHTTQTGVSWVFTSFLLSASVATPVLGRLGDILGKRRVLIAVFVAVVIGSVAAALATSLGVMIAARAVQGIGAAVFPLAFGIIRDQMPAERVAGAVGGVSAILGIGSGMGIVIAGPVIDHLTWHWLFWIPAAMAAVTLAAMIRFVPESPVRAPGRINVGAALALSSWLVALLVAVSQGGTWGWTSSTTLGLLAASVVGFAVWIAVELRSREPLVDVRMMRERPVWWTNVSALLFGFGMYSLMVMVPSFMSAPSSGGYGFDSSPTGVGLAMLPNTFGMLVIGLVIGRITGRWGAKLPLVIGGIIDAVALGVLALAHDELWMVFATLALFGLGMGLAFSSMTNVIVDAVPPEHTGVATGMNANIRTIGGSIGSQVVSAIIVADAAPGGLPPESGYTHGLVAMAIALGAAGLAAIAIPATVRAARSVGEGEFTGDPRVEDERVDGSVFERPELALAADAVLVAAAADIGGHHTRGRL